MESWLIEPSTIEKQVLEKGFYYHRGLGKLRAGTVSRGFLVGMIVSQIVITLILFGAANLRVAAARVETYKAQLMLDDYHTQMMNAAIQSDANRREFQVCKASLTHINETMNEAVAEAQRQAPINPNAALVLKILVALRSVLM